MAKKKTTQIKITQIKSLIGQKEDQCRTVKALGLKRIRHSVVKQATLPIKGMIHKVRHLVTVEIVD